MNASMGKNGEIMNETMRNAPRNGCGLGGSGLDILNSAWSTRTSIHSSRIRLRRDTLPALFLETLGSASVKPEEPKALPTTTGDYVRTDSGEYIWMP